MGLPEVVLKEEKLLIATKNNLEGEQKVESLEDDTSGLVEALLPEQVEHPEGEQSLESLNKEEDSSQAPVSIPETIEEEQVFTENPVSFEDNENSKISLNKEKTSYKGPLLLKSHKLLSDTPQEMEQYKNEILNIKSQIESGNFDSIGEKLGHKFSPNKLKMIFNVVREQSKNFSQEDFLLQSISMWIMINAEESLRGLEGIKKGLHASSQKISDVLKQDANLTCVNLAMLAQHMGKMFDLELKIKQQPLVSFKPKFSVIPAGHRHVYSETGGVIDVVWGDYHGGYFSSKEDYYKTFPQHVAAKKQNFAAKMKATLEHQQTTEEN
jgi:hypothetical protein